jgi:hypothetical protein
MDPPGPPTSYAFAHIFDQSQIFGVPVEIFIIRILECFPLNFINAVHLKIGSVLVWGFCTALMMEERRPAAVLLVVLPATPPAAPDRDPMSPLARRISEFRGFIKIALRRSEKDMMLTQ